MLLRTNYQLITTFDYSNCRLAVITMCFVLARLANQFWNVYNNTLKGDFIDRHCILRNQHFRNLQQQLYRNSTNISKQH